MIIYAVYVISSDGRLMLSEIYQNTEDLPNEYILSGLLTSFKAISNELTNAYPETLVMGSDISYHFENFQDYFLVIVTDSKTKPSSLAFSLGMKFTSTYGHLVDGWEGETEIFYPFKSIMEEEVSKFSTFDESGSIKPNQRLDAGELMFLDAKLKPIATALLSLEEASIRELWLELKDEQNAPPFHQIRSLLSELQEKGYVGYRHKEGTRVYFV